VKRLIVNADDFGLTAGVSRGILEAHRRGIVTSTTVLINLLPGDALFDSLRESCLGIGLHLNLTLGTPLSSPGAVPSLLGDGGRFIRDPAVAASRLRVEEAERELEAQVEAFISRFGEKPTHLDSHHHIGCYPPVRGIMLDLAASLGVPLRATDAETREAARRRGCATPDHFFGDAGPDPYWTTGRILDHLASLPEGVSEFMTHPGYFDEALAESRYNRHREIEMARLSDPAVRDAVAASGIILCHFGTLLA
jgi:predicted glycoside hydrolase/deacetylase ChbG (UPF0249 family)